jgi:SAM-dependent methyltransferase
MTDKWLPLLAEGVPFMEHSVLTDWNDLEGAVRRGGPATSHYEERWQDPTWWRDFQLGMMAIARMASESIVDRVKLPSSARRLLDVGGGHGLHAISFCRRHANLTATVFDWPQALEITREVIACERMEDRVTTQAGDFLRDDLGSGYEVALVFNIVHGYQPDQNVELLRKVVAALNPGGMVVIFDQVVGRVMGPTARAVVSLQGLNLFIGSGGRTYAFDEIAGWLRKAGFESPRRIGLLKSPGFALVVASKAG